jgi:hypothetical protein
VKRIGKFLTFSNVIACLALFVALGGSVYAAAKINGKQIRKSSLPGNRVKPKTITARRIKPQTLTGGQVKPKSLTGSEIDQKTLTEVSAAALAGVRYESTTTTIPTWGRPATSATANCPSGTYAIGGGATVSRPDEATINESAPTPLRTGWTATGFAWYSAGNTMTVTAICMAIEDPRGAATVVPAGPKYNPAD